MVSSAFDPLRVPDEFWAREDMGQTLDRRGFGECYDENIPVAEQRYQRWLDGEYDTERI